MRRQQYLQAYFYLMKSAPISLLAAFLAFGLLSSLRAETHEYPQVSLSWPGVKAPTIPRSEVLIIVVEGSVLIHEGKPLPSTNAVEFVNSLLKARNISHIGVYTRAGTKFGDVMRALDTLRATSTQAIGVSVTELAPGQEP